MKEGSHAKFTCFTSKPTWTFDLNLMLPENAVKLKNGVLIIESVSTHNEGYYECAGRTKENETFDAYGELVVMSKLLQ